MLESFRALPHFCAQNLVAMPPKPRVARSARGGRGGAAASRSSTQDTASSSTPQSAAPATASDASAQPVVLKHDDDEDSKPPTTSESTPAPTAAQEGPVGDASYVFLVSYEMRAQMLTSGSQCCRNACRWHRFPWSTCRTATRQSQCVAIRIPRRSTRHLDPR